MTIITSVNIKALNDQLGSPPHRRQKGTKCNIVANDLSLKKSSKMSLLQSVKELTNNAKG